MEKKELEKINKFVEDWKDHFYHNRDGCETDAEDMLKNWEMLKLTLEVKN